MYAVPSNPRRKLGEICFPTSTPKLSLVDLKKGCPVVGVYPPTFTPTCQLSKNLP